VTLPRVCSSRGGKKSGEGTSPPGDSTSSQVGSATVSVSAPPAPPQVEEVIEPPVEEGTQTGGGEALPTECVPPPDPPDAPTSDEPPSDQPSQEDDEEKAVGVSPDGR
jgi:hypothetical protein